MAAMKPRTGDGPLEVTKEGRGIVMRVPLEGGGRLVVEMSAEEASDLGDALKAAAGCTDGRDRSPVRNRRVRRKFSGLVRAGGGSSTTRRRPVRGPGRGPVVASVDVA